MKKSGKPEQSCRRQEFVCRLYDVIKDLDSSLKSDCSQGTNRFAREKDNPFQPRIKKMDIENKKKGSECFCPPGCCQDSMEFKLSRIPNYPGRESARDQGSNGNPLQGQGGNQPKQEQEPSQHVWHQAYHNNGCWPGHDHGETGRAAGQSRPLGQSQGFHVPGSPEEAVAMGCFVARSN